MTIGEACKLTGLSSKMIRHYEKTSLIKPVCRTQSGYRVYNNNDLNQLTFIRQSKELGFSLREIHSLLELWLNPLRESKRVKQITDQHLYRIEQKINALHSIQSTLRILSKQCNANETPNCAILEGLQPRGY
ncbi:MerR family transcriptional regulator [Vibrio sp. F74]|uniref:MerR family transcriptional regulator n=1 Tax=Vibrio sp. F74 TaxID=700020 RepID=UPI0036F44C98